MKIIKHIGYFRWLGPNVWWNILQIWLDYIKPIRQIDGLLQDCSNSIANALELLQSCTKPSKCLLNHESFSGTLHCCCSTCQISVILTLMNLQSCNFEIFKDLTIRHLIWYWNGSQNFLVLIFIMESTLWSESSKHWVKSWRQSFWGVDAELYCIHLWISTDWIAVESPYKGMIP